MKTRTTLTIVLPFLMIGLGCRAVEDSAGPSVQSNELDRLSGRFHDRGGPAPYFGFDSRAADIEKRLGVGQ